jgi:hypothetical protein
MVDDDQMICIPDDIDTSGLWRWCGQVRCWISGQVRERGLLLLGIALAVCP